VPLVVVLVALLALGRGGPVVDGAVGGVAGCAIAGVWIRSKRRHGA
jgi:hypothetical protein